MIEITRLRKRRNTTASYALKRRLIFPVVALFLFIGSAKAQVSGYVFNESLTGFTPLTSSTVVFNAPWDAQGSTVTTLPFDFVFDGNTFNQVRINCNGYLTFGTAAPTGGANNPLTNTTAHGGAVSALGMDLVGPDDPITYGVLGSAPNRRFVVQWTNAQRKSDNAGSFNFQIILHETTNVIEFSYGLCTTSSTTNRPAAVGLRGSQSDFTQGNGINRSLSSYTEWFNNTTPGSAPNATLRTRNDAYPDLGLRYTWTPPAPCTTPPAQPSNLVVGSTSVTHNTFVGNSFNPASPAPTSYLVLRSTENTPPTAALLPNRTFAPAVGSTVGIYTVVSKSSETTFTQVGLAPGTTYYYWVIPYNDLCFGAPFYNWTNIISASATTCSQPTTAYTPSIIGGNDFLATWDVVPSATEYRIDVSATSDFTAILPEYNNLSVGSATSFSVTNLLPMTTYYYRVHAIGPGCSVPSNVVSISTTCGYYAIPYIQNFDAPAFGIGSVPTCFTRTDVNGDSIRWGIQSVTYASAPKSIYIAKNTTQAMDDWFFLPGLNLTGGTSYRLFFRYNTNAGSSQAEVLRVLLGSDALPGAMSQTLVDLTNINNTIFKSTYVDFTPVTSGVYYVGFHGSSMADQSYIAVDDISVTLAPTCLDPVDVTVDSVATNSASISWEAPLIEPASGYQYYVSTNPTAPTGSTAPSGTIPFGATSFNLTGLNASTTYYFWMRGNCSPSDKSIWTTEQVFSTACSTPSITSTSPASRCGMGTVTLSATASSGATVQWYADATGDAIIGTGSSFTTPELLSTTTFYAEAKALGAIAKAGPATPATHGGSTGVQNYPASVNFTVLSPTTLLAIDIFPIASGQSGTIALRNSSNLNLATFNFTTNVSGGATPQNITINHTLTPGTYNLYLSGIPASGLSMNTTDAFYPYSSSVAEITGNIVSNTQFLGFYNWRFTTECLSPRVPVIATVTTPPAMALSISESIICSGESTPTVTVSGHGSYNNLSWSPSEGVSGDFVNGFTFSPAATTTYTLTAMQTGGSQCINTATLTVNVNASPPPVAMIPSTPEITLCEGAVQPLNGSIGELTNATIYQENFNNPVNGWTVTNTSTDGNTAASEWTHRNSPYVYSSSTWNITLSSNDNSGFYFANSDSQGNSSLPFAVTRTSLTSPIIDMSGNTSASLEFYHYLRYILGDTFTIEISTNGGSTWSLLENFVGTKGTATNFAPATINLDAYVGISTIRLRFNMVSHWGYGWAIDNIHITGSIAAALEWSPETGLYTDPAATIPYVAGTPATVVYAKPTETTTYSAIAVNSNGCTSEGTIIVKVDDAPLGGTLSLSQALCTGTGPDDINLTGHSGDIIRWECADDEDFTTNVLPIINTSTTLTSAQIGTITTVKYFRAVVSNGTCPEVYSDVSSVSFPTSVWNGSSWSPSPPTAGVKAVFNGNYTASGDLHACAVQVNSGTVTVGTGFTLFVENEVNVAGGSLVFEDDASLVQISNAVNSGNIVYKRNTTPVRKFDYTYWSSPVSGLTLGALSPNTNPTVFYIWNTGIYNWSSVPTSTVMVPGIGYIVRAPDIAPFNPTTPNVFHAVLNGVPNNGDISAPIAASGSNTLNLIGNPYPSAIDADAFFLHSANLGVVDATIYLWTHNTPITNNEYTSNDYAVYNLMGGAATSPAPNSGVNNSLPTGKVAAGQSFFIHGTANGSVTFNNSMRLGGSNSQFFRMSASASPGDGVEKHRIWLDVRNPQGAFKQILVGYTAGATTGFDRGFDGLAVDGGNFIGFYSFGPEKLSIQGRPLPFDVNDEVPLGFRSSLSGSFEISLSQFDGLFVNQDVWLEDKYTGQFHNLKISPYSFTTATGTFDDRFVLRYGSALSVPDVAQSHVVIYKSEGLWQVHSGSVNMTDIKVFDVRGRLLMSKPEVNATHSSLDVAAANQMLLVQITTIDGSVVTKKILN